jgi:hypothetical protein
MLQPSVSCPAGALTPAASFCGVRQADGAKDSTIVMATSLRPIVSLLIGVALLLAGAGLQVTLLPLRGSAEGFSTFALGVIGSAYYVGFVTGCLAGPFVILQAGHIRAFAALVAMAAAAVLAYGLAPDPIAWTCFARSPAFRSPVSIS